MKILLNILMYILTLGLIYFAFYNFGEAVNVVLLAPQCADQLNSLHIGHFTPVSFYVNFTWLVLSCFAIGLLAAAGWLGQLYLTQSEKLKAYKRELEKNSLTNSSSTSRIEVLEAKIKTLEKALDEALDK